MFFAIGCMIVFEVVARYVFIAPTIWAEEMSQFFQIWATYLAAAYLLHNRQLIAIDVITRRFPTPLRKTCEGFTLVIIGIFAGVAVFYGADIVIESIEQGRATSTMLGVPKWMTESAIPVGFGVLLLQVFAEFIRLFNGADDVRPSGFGAGH